MKTRLLLLQLLLFTSTAILAQYQEIGVQGRRWNEYVVGQVAPGAMHFYEIDSDTLFRGEMLPRLVELDDLGNRINTVAVIEEDTAKPSITFHAADTTHAFYFLYGDSVYLDLSLSIGDSVAYSCTDVDTSYYVLDSVKTFTDLTFQSRQQYFFHVNVPIGAEVVFNWVEGLGSVDQGGIVYFMPIICVSDVPHPQLLCVTNSSTVKLYQNPNFLGCYRDVGLEELDFEGSAIYPNPATSVVHLKNLPLEKATEINLITMDGRTVRAMQAPFAEHINVEGLREGAYQLEVRFNNGQAATYKLLISR